jgi:hypothetical protein
MHCRQCDIRNCAEEKGYTGCHQCAEFPCHHIDNFSMTVGKKVILRAIPYRREVGDEKWIQDEEARYICPECGNKVFRGVAKCNQCKTQLNLDGSIQKESTTSHNHNNDVESCRRPRDKAQNKQQFLGRDGFVMLP